MTAKVEMEVIAILRCDVYDFDFVYDYDYDCDLIGVLLFYLHSRYLVRTTMNKPRYFNPIRGREKKGDTIFCVSDCGSSSGSLIFLLCFKLDHTSKRDGRSSGR